MVAPWSRGRLAAAMIEGVEAMDVEMFEFTRLHAAGGPQALSPAVRDLLEAADLVVSFISDGRDTWAANVRRLAPRAHLVCLPTRPPEGWAGHVADRHRAELAAHGVTLTEVPLPVARNNHGPVVVHPGSGGVSQVLAGGAVRSGAGRARRDAGRPVRVIYGDAEAERWPAQRLARWRDRYGARPAAPRWRRSSSNCFPAAAYLGNDAGPTHLAAQLGLPTLALFGPTDPRVWAPRGPAVRVLAPNTPTAMTWLDVPPVLDALHSILAP